MSRVCRRGQRTQKKIKIANNKKVQNKRKEWIQRESKIYIELKKILRTGAGGRRADNEIMRRQRKNYNRKYNDRVNRNA